MPNHVHLIIHPHSVGYQISEILKRIKQPVSRKSLAYLRNTTPEWMDHLKQQRGQKTEYHFWQRGGGYDRNITEGETLMNMIDYIHLNPVRSGHVYHAIKNTTTGSASS
jgi:putative transposase